MQPFNLIEITARRIPDSQLEPDENMFEVTLAVDYGSGNLEKIYQRGLPDRNSVERALKALVDLI